MEQMKAQRQRVLKTKSKRMLQVRKIDEDCIKNEELCIKKGDFIPKTMDFIPKMMEFVLNNDGYCIKKEMGEFSEVDESSGGGGGGGGYEFASVAMEEEKRKKELADLVASLAKAEEEATAAEKLVTNYTIKLKTVSEPNDKCDKGLNECTVTIHGDLNE